MNWPVIIIVGLLALALLAFVIMRNQKDEKKFEEDVMNEDTKPGEIEITEAARNDEN